MLLQGKKGLVLNVTNKNSIGWAVARLAAMPGVRLAYPLDALTLSVERSGKPCQLDAQALTQRERFAEQDQQWIAGVVRDAKRR